MPVHSLILLLTCTTLFGVHYCQPNCSFSYLIKNLTFPNPLIRPVKNWRTATEINIGMTLYTVIKLDTSEQTLTTLVWFTMAWKNEFIQWNLEQFCNIENILLSNDTYWQPDLYIYERIDSEDKSPVVPFYSIDHNGQVQRALPLRIVSSCKQDIFKFPIDTQRCNLTFGSYIHSVEDIKMVTNSNSSEVFKKSNAIFVSKGDWNLLNITVRNKIVPVNGINYSAVYYEITVQRVPQIYIITLIIPACLMVVLDIVSMFIKVESEERLTFKIVLVLGFSVLLLILNNMIPITQVPPVLGIFYCVCMGVMVISIIGCIAIDYMLMLSETQTTVPSWIKTWVLRYLACVLCIKGKIFMKYRTNHAEKETYINQRVIEEQGLKYKRNLSRYKEDSMEVKLLKILLLEVFKIHKQIVDCREKDDIRTEWRAAAHVVDRFILIVYLAIVFSLFAAVIIVCFE